MAVRLVVLVTISFGCFTRSIVDAQDNNFILNQTAITSQYDALRQFYLSTKMYSESSRMLHNWSFDRSTSDGEYCSFTGITCDRNFMVTAIELNSTELAGRLPDTLNGFSSLRRMRLYNNSIEGSIPINLLQIPTLQLLNLGQNLISGTIPDFSPSKLFTRLILRRNAISGTIPYSLCNLTNLVVFELSQLTRMRGKIPDCFGQLTALTALRLSDIGLTGTVPSELCSVRSMNGLTPNTFGCDAIACPVGSFQRSVGRQSNENTPCSPCNVPSNVIGTTTCQWHEINNPSLPPSSQPVLVIPTAAPSRSQLPTTEPSVIDSSAEETMQPSNIRPVIDAPFTSMPKPSGAPTGTSFPPIIENQSSENGIFTHPGYLAGLVLICILFPIIIVALFVRQRRTLVLSHKRLHDETSSYPGSSLQDVAAETDFPTMYPSIVEIKMNRQQSSEFDVGDDRSLNFNDVRFATYELTPGSGPSVNLIEDHEPKDTSSHRPIEVPEIQPLSNNDMQSSARKVRFTVPDSKAASTMSHRDDHSSTNFTAAKGRDDWISWILNPLFDPIATCGVSCNDISKSDVDITSAISLDSTYSNLSALFVAHGAMKSVPPVTPSIPEASTVLGIRDFNSMNDDSSLNSLDGTVVADVGAIFRHHQESRRRARATWNSLVVNVSQQGTSPEVETMEV